MAARDSPEPPRDNLGVPQWFASTVVTAVGLAIGAASGRLHPRTSGALIAAVGLCCVVRVGIHVAHPRCRYFRLQREFVALDALVVLDATISLGFVALGILQISSPDPGRHSVLVVLGAAGYGVVSALAVRTAGALGLERGTEAIVLSAPIRLSRDLANRLSEIAPVRALDTYVHHPTPREHVSRFVIIVLALTGGVFAANANAASDTIEKTLGGNPTSKQESKTPNHARRAQARDADRSPRGPETRPGARASGTSPSPGQLDAGTGYAGQCATGVDPGWPAPRQLAADLRSLWLGGDGRNGAGAIEAGCAEPALPVPGHKRIWYAAGFCGAKLRTLGVAVLGRPPALLFQQAASVALRLARAGRLLGATPRLTAGTGDLYLLQTPDGTVVMIRPQSANGGVAVAPATRECERLDSQNVRYIVLPPPLSRLWFASLRSGWSWPIGYGTHKGAQRFLFVGDDPARTRVGVALCSHGSCELRRSGSVLTATHGAALTQELLWAYLPAAR